MSASRLSKRECLTVDPPPPTLPNCVTHHIRTPIEHDRKLDFLSDDSRLLHDVGPLLLMVITAKTKENVPRDQIGHAVASALLPSRRSVAQAFAHFQLT